MASKIFINYRRSVNLKDAQLLEKVLHRHFAKSRVFLDVSGIDGGDHWLHTLERQVDDSVAMVSLLGKGWADVRDDQGNRRLDNPNDFVRFEIARAFARKLPVLPVRIDGASMPQLAELPTNLAPLTFPQAMLLRAESFDDDADKIARRLKELVAAARPRGVSMWRAGALAAAALAVGVAAGPYALTTAGMPLPWLGVAAETDLHRRADTADKARKAAEAQLALAREAKAAADGEAQKQDADVRRLRSLLAGEKESSGKARASIETLNAQAEEQRKAAAEALAQVDRLKQQIAAKERDVAALTAQVRREREARAKAEAEAKRQAALAAQAKRDLQKAEEGRRIAGLKSGQEHKHAEAETLKSAFRDCPDVCPEMVAVPAGEFTMGSPPGEEGRGSAEGPQRKVTIARPFAVGKYEVTFAEWDACVAAGGCKHTPTDSGWGRGKRPVVNVSWNDITKEYLPWLSRNTGTTYRLPTEAEWEYAARAGTTTPFSVGRMITTKQANFEGKRTVEVGSFPPNAFGLHDMHGNVWEWVQDCWNANYSGAPSDGSAWTTGDCGRRVLRGGSGVNYPQDLRSADRFRFTPDLRFHYFGFRVVRTLDA